MKGLTVDEFMQIGVKEQPPEKTKAVEIINAFIKRWEVRDKDSSDISVFEVEESDFDNAFKFNEPKQILRAATLLRNVANKNDKYNIAVKQRGGRLFVGMREEIEPNYRSWR